MSTPPEDHPSTPTAPRVSVVPEESIYLSPTTLGQSPPPQHLRSPQAEEADLRMIRARHNQDRDLGIQLRPKGKSSGSPTPGHQRTAEDGRIPSLGVTEPRSKPLPLRLPHTRPPLDLNAHQHPDPHLYQQEPQPQELIFVPMEPLRLLARQWNHTPPRPRLCKSSG